MGVYHHDPRGGEPHASDYVTTAAVGCQMYVKQVEMAADGPLTVSVEPVAAFPVRDVREAGAAV